MIEKRLNKRICARCGSKFQPTDKLDYTCELCSKKGGLKSKD
jgi:DNA-directed RNA polymerase subunit RPC12/RpoP